MSYPQSTAYTMMMKLFLAGTNTPATGKTAAVTISKAGGAFGNPSAGAVNATEISAGVYFYALSTTDTNTLGDLWVQFTATGCDVGDRCLPIVSATTGGATNLDAAVSSRSTYAGGAVASVIAGVTVTTNDDKTGYSLAASQHVVVDSGTVTNLTNAPTNGDLTAAMMASVTAAVPTVIAIQTGLATPTNITGGTITNVGTVANLTNAPTAGDLTATMKTSVAQSVLNAVAASFDTAGTIGAAINAANAPTTSQIAAAILKTPAFLIATNSDNSVNADVTLSDEEIAAIAAAVIAGLAGANITLVSPLSEDGATLSLTTGDSYTVANGRSLTFNIANQNNLIGTIAHLRIQGRPADLAVSPAIVSATQSVIFGDILATLTSQLNLGNYEYQIRFMNGLDVATVIQGQLQVTLGV